MYPASLLGLLYNATDLPEQIEVYWQGAGITPINAVLSKTGSQYESGTVTLAVENGEWTLRDSSVEFILSQGECLTRSAIGIITDPFPFFDCIDLGLNLDEGCENRRDLFEDSYTASWQGEIFVLERVSLCRWEKQIVIGSRLYNIELQFLSYGLFGTPESPAAPVGWYASWSFDTIGGQGDAQGGGPKDGAMNTPVGAYTDPNSQDTLIIQ